MQQQKQQQQKWTHTAEQLKSRLKQEPKITSFSDLEEIIALLYKCLLIPYPELSGLKAIFAMSH